MTNTLPSLRSLSIEPSPSFPILPNYGTEIGSRHYLEILAHFSTNMVPMQRIVIIGSSGSGKSTLARSLGHTLHIDVIHLDKHFWHPGWVPTDPNTWQATVRKMVQSPSWIIDGNYRGTLEIRMKAADTVIFLDMPRLVCMWRAIKRRLKYAYIARPDMTSGCDEQIFDPSLFNFLRRIWNYPYRARPDIQERLRHLNPDQQLFWLRSSAEVNRFLAALSTTSAVKS
jgi:adenylate kinase family enzyme